MDVEQNGGKGFRFQLSWVQVMILVHVCWVGMKVGKGARRQPSYILFQTQSGGVQK